MNTEKQKRRVLKLLSQQAHVQQQMTDALLDESRAKHATCKRGCNACCKQVPSANFAEAVQIVQYKTRQVYAAEPKLRYQAGLIASIAENLGTNDSDAICSEYWKLQLPCAFLDRAGDCSIYEVRPMACRAYLVQSDPGLCYELEPQKVEILSSAGVQKMAEAQYELEQTLGLASTGVLQMEMVQAIDILLRPAKEPRDA